MTDDVSVKFGADLGDLDSAISETKDSFGQLAEAAKYAAEAFAVDKVVEYVKGLAEVGEQLERMSAMTGLSLDSLQTLNFAIQRTGGDAEGAGQMMMRFERNIETAATGSGPAYAAFQKLGISLHDLQTMSIDDLLQKTAEGFRNLTDPIERSAVASQVGGRSFAQMLPALLESQGGLEDFHKRLVELNDDLSDQTVKDLANTSHGFTDLSRAVQGAGVQAFELFKDEINGVLEDLTAAVVVIGKAIEKFKELQVVVGVDVVIAFGKMVEAVKTVGAELDYAGQAIIIRWKEVGAILTEVATGHWSQIAAVQAEANAEVAEAAKGATVAITGYQQSYEKLKASAIEAGNAVLTANNAIKATASATTANRGGGAGGAAPDNTLALNDIKTDEQIAQLNLATQKSILGQEAAYHSITKQQEIEQEKQFTDAAYEIDQSALQDKLALYQQGTTEYETTLNEMDVLYAKHTAQIAALDQKMAEANAAQTKQMAAQWNEVFNVIDRSLDTMLQGVLQGTQTWQQAMTKVFDNIALAFIEDVAKMTAKWLAFEALKTFAPGSSLTASVGSTIPSFLGGSQNGAQDAAMTALTTALTANTAALTGQTVSTTVATASTDANTTAQSGGVVQWIANTAATIANTVATDAAAIGHLLGFDVGTASLPFTGPILAHKGEMILPPDISASVRAGNMTIGAGPQGGGSTAVAAGDNYSITISAIDTQTGATFLKNNIRTIAQSLSQQVRNNNSNLPGWKAVS